jgi:MFS family permease
MPQKSRSLLALDALNFFNAGIQTGLGPFIAIYYASGRHWNPSQVGFLLGLQSLAGVVSQTAIGNAVDETKYKRLVSILAALVVVAGCMGIVVGRGMWVQGLAQVAIGVAITVFPATTSAFALGLVDRKEVSQRIARNEAFTHGGNVIFAVLAGVVGLMLALRDIFVAAAIFAGGMGFSAFLIRAQDVNHEAARAGDEGSGDQAQPQRKGWRELLHDSRILAFMGVVVLFNVANASTLPLVGQLLSQARKGAAVWQTTACVIVAEIVMVLVAWLIGKRVDMWGRKPLFIAAFATLAIRNGLTTVSHAEAYLIALQALDGIAAAMYGVLLTLVAADLARGTGRFNFLQGALQSAMGLGGFSSNLLFGFIAKRVSFNASFLGLAAAAVSGGLLYLIKMPETRQN